jgi:hypothetical protein
LDVAIGVTAASGVDPGVGAVTVAADCEVGSPA